MLVITQAYTLEPAPSPSMSSFSWCWLLRSTVLRGAAERGLNHRSALNQADNPTPRGPIVAYLGAACVRLGLIALIWSGGVLTGLRDYQLDD